ncbi:MAG: RND transporter [Gammaproteobacteria bacterium]|nr:MAG: RND transporter [Pseudomonadota bacterium]PIE38222.1 MAG: RND transporter [Gammaproteobacteria bacterium]
MVASNYRPGSGGSALVSWSMLHAKWVFRILLIAVLLVGAQIFRIQVDTDPENMLAPDHPERVLHDQIRHSFGLSDMLVVGIVNKKHPDGVFNAESLSLVSDISKFALGIEGVVQKDLMSLSTVDDIKQMGPGTIQFRWMMDQVPETTEKAAAIREAVSRLPMLQNTLVSGDGQAVAIYVPIVAKSESYRVATELRDFVTQKNPSDEFYITGLPVAEDTFGVEMFIQMAISAPAAALMIFLLMWLFFRNVPLVTSPMIMAMAVVILIMGLMIGMGYTVHIMSSMIPIFLMPIAVVDSVHILSEFADDYREGDDVKVVVRRVMANLFKPMLFTSITSSIGFASLALTPIPPVQVFGLFVAVGIMLAFFLTLTFIPAYIASLKPETLRKLASRTHRVDGSQGRFARILNQMGTRSLQFKKGVLVFFVALIGLSFWGIQQIKINDNPVRWFAEGHEIRQADKVMNAHFAGTYEVYLSLESDHAEQIWREFKTRAESMARPVPGLSTWLNEQFDLIDESEEEPFNTLVTVLDNALFDGEYQNREAVLEELLEAASVQQAKARYFQQPEALAYIGRLQEYLNGTGLVGKSNSLADLVKTVYRELKGEKGTLAIPETAQGVADTLLSFQGSHRPQDLWHLVTPDYNSTVIWLQLKSGDNQDMEAVLDSVNRFFENNPLPEGVTANWAGLTYINVVWQDAMVKGMVASLPGSFVMVFIVMVILFRSLLFGVLAMLPLTITIMFIYGLIGIIGKDYDMPIAVLSSLTLGLSVDFAIHFLQRSREIYSQTGNWKETVSLMFDEPARAIGRNATVIALGFTPLLLAPLVPYNTVGVFLAAIMLVSCLVTLALLPAIMGMTGARLFAGRGTGDSEQNPS